MSIKSSRSSKVQEFMVLAPKSKASSRKQLTKMKKKNSKKLIETEVTLEGAMSFGKLEDGRHVADFMCMEDVQMQDYTARCKVEVKRDGNVYVTELQRRKKNKPIFRDDNSSLSLGTDGKYYFYFALPEQLVNELPAQLIRQATAIARKVMNEIINA